MTPSGFRSLHPAPLLAYYAGAALLSMMLLHPVFLGSSVLFWIALNLTYGSRENMLRTLILFMAAGAVLFVFNPLFSRQGEHVIFLLGNRPVTLEAIGYGATLILSVLSVLFAFMSYRLVVTTDKFVYLFGGMWPKGTLLLVMAMRFFPLLQDRLRIVTRVQRAKGVSLRRGTLRERGENGMRLLQALLGWSLEEALQTADSMKARGFGTGPRSAYAAYRMRLRDWTTVLWLTAAFLVCLTGWFYGYGRLTFYPSLEPLRLQSAEQVCYAVFLLYLGTPIIVDGKEWLRWRYYR